MRKAVLVLLLLWPSLAAAGIVNVEFNFTPFIGDLKANQVETVPGVSTVYLNNVPIASKEIEKENVQVLFQNREIAAEMWVPASAMGPGLRKGKNKIRIEFDPVDAKAPYRAQFRWALVSDQATKTGSLPGRVTETNESGNGSEEKKATGRVVFEREFTADFAPDQPWHHYPPVTTLSAEDKKSLALLVKQREEALKPDFTVAYQILGRVPNLEVTEIKKIRLLEKCNELGIRIAALPSDQLDFVITGNPEVVVRGKGAELFHAVDQTALSRLGESDQMAVMMVFSVLFPQRIVAVRTPSGKWEAVY